MWRRLLVLSAVLLAALGVAGLTIRWRKANDLGRPIKGYRVERNKRAFATLSPKARSIVVPFSKARGTWTVRAIG